MGSWSSRGCAQSAPHGAIFFGAGAAVRVDHHVAGRRPPGDGRAQRGHGELGGHPLIQGVAEILVA